MFPLRDGDSGPRDLHHVGRLRRASFLHAFPLLLYCYGCIYGCIVRMYCSCGMQYWLEYVVEVSFMYLLRVLVYILMVREWSLIYNPCAGVSFQVLK